MQILIALLLIRALFVPRALPPQSQLQQFVGIIVRVIFILIIHEDGFFEDALHVAALGSNDPPCHLELPLILNLYLITACQFVLFGSCHAALFGVDQCIVISGFFVVEEVLPVEAIDEEVDFG